MRHVLVSSGTRSTEETHKEYRLYLLAFIKTHHLALMEENGGINSDIKLRSERHLRSAPHWRCRFCRASRRDNYGSDKLLVKLFVIMMLILEVLHSILNTYSVYQYIILNYGNPLALLDENWSLSAELAQSGVSIFAVHMFYVKRVYYVSQKNVPLVALIFALALARFGMNLLVTVNGFQLRRFSLPAQLARYLGASFSLSAATDIIIAGSLSFYLHKRRSGRPSTRTMLNRLIMHTINNGILTSIFDILVVIFAMVQPQEMIYVAISQIISNLYTNSMLATLNARRSMGRASEVTRISFCFPVSASTSVISAINEPDSPKSDVPRTNTDGVEHGPSPSSEDTTTRSINIPVTHCPRSPAMQAAVMGQSA